MDQLRHVNNVTYADYLQEARISFFRALALSIGGPDPARDTDHDTSHDTGHDTGDEVTEEAYGIVVVRHEMTYLAPLTHDFEPVSIETWVVDVRAASFTVGYEIFRELDDGTRRVFLRATTRLAPFVFGSARPRRLTDAERAAMAPYVEPPETPTSTVRPPRARRTEVGHYPVTVRFSDLDPYGHVNNVTYLEYFQEARIVLNSRLWRDLPPGTPRIGLVVAQADVDYLRPLLGRAEGYDLWTWIERVGNRSAVMSSEVRDGDTVMARATVVVVFYDSDAGRSAEPPEVYREVLRRALEAPDDPAVVAVATAAC